MHVPQEEVVIIESTTVEAKNALVGNGNGTQLQSVPADGANGHVPAKRPTRNMNMHGVFLHVLADALGSVIVIISALIVQYTDWAFNIYVDPALSVIMVCIISHSTLPLREYSFAYPFWSSNRPSLFTH